MGKLPSIRWLQHRQLHIIHVFVALEVIRLEEIRGPSRAVRVVFVEERRACLVLDGPGECAVRQRLREDDAVPGGGGDSADGGAPRILGTLRNCVQVAVMLWKVQVGLVAAGHAGESTAVAVGVLELKRDRHQPILGAAVLPREKAVPAARVVPSVQIAPRERAGASVHVDVVETEAGPNDLLQDGADGGVRH